jgi:hypothetical protein
MGLWKTPELELNGDRPCNLIHHSAGGGRDSFRIHPVIKRVEWSESISGVRGF